MTNWFIIFLFLLAINVSATTPDWSNSASLENGKPRYDLYEHGRDLEDIKKQGYIHALKWPVEVTGLLVPYEPVKYFLESEKETALERLIEAIGERAVGFKTFEEMYNWLGLNKYPQPAENRAPFYVPYPDGNDYQLPEYRMGASLIQTPHGKGLTFACATCHSGTFLGHSIMGLTNKRPRANEFFVMAKKYIPFVPPGLFKVGTKATDGEKKMFARTQRNLQFVGSVSPLVRGLDTSLPHVALSLDKRLDDDIATKKLPRRRSRKRHPLYTTPGDSKPMPWWNLKYKTRWLSDGSIISGNPVLTNFLWNEIGRGTDLVELEDWMKNNQKTVADLTAAVFATRSPHWTDFYPSHTLDLDMAKRGESVFKESCQKCHGTYIKNWSLPNASELSYTENLKTFQILYHKKTPVKDVGTDPYRYMATKYFAGRLNKLRISKWMETVVVPQVGYVPPPLEGIFMRYPYMHNNSIPNLCALMKKVSDRPKKFVQGPSRSPADYDEECVGYPVGEDIPLSWWNEEDAIFDASRKGLSNSGHTQAFYDKEGNSKMTDIEKRELLEFLKTL